MYFGSDCSQSSNGWSASTTISSLPLLNRRTTPGLCGDKGISTHSRFNPSESVTPRIWVMCLNETTVNGIGFSTTVILDFSQGAVNAWSCQFAKVWEKIEQAS